MTNLNMRAAQNNYWNLGGSAYVLMDSDLIQVCILHTALGMLNHSLRSIDMPDSRLMRLH